MNSVLRNQDEHWFPYLNAKPNVYIHKSKPRALTYASFTVSLDTDNWEQAYLNGIKENS